MKFANLIGPGANQVFVASVELRTAEIGRGKMHLLNRRACGTIQHHDAFRKGLPKRFESVAIPDHFDDSKPPFVQANPRCRVSQFDGVTASISFNSRHWEHALQMPSNAYPLVRAEFIAQIRDARRANNHPR